MRLCCLLLLGAIVVVVVLLLLKVSKGEMFEVGETKFLETDGMEFRGMNMLGLFGENYFASPGIDWCRLKCARNEPCKAFSFYKPGNRCYLWESGGFVPGRSEYYSGVKSDAYSPLSFVPESLNY